MLIVVIRNTAKLSKLIFCYCRIGRNSLLVMSSTHIINSNTDIMYYYEQSFLNGKPCYIAFDPDGELRVFENEIDASFFVDWLNTIEQ